MPQVSSACEAIRFPSVVLGSKTLSELKAASKRRATSDAEIDGKLPHSIATIPLINTHAHDTWRAPQTHGLLFEAFAVHADVYKAP